MKHQLIEILPNTRNEVDALLGGARPRLLITEHYFPGNANHRLVASGSDFGFGAEAVFAALRLMHAEPCTCILCGDPYVVPAYQWGG